MNAKEYSNEIMSISSLIAGNPQEAARRLDALARYKPVPLKWFNARARAYAGLGQYEQARALLEDVLTGKCYAETTGNDAEEYYRTLILIYEALNDSENSEYYATMLQYAVQRRYDGKNSAAKKHFKRLRDEQDLAFAAFSAAPGEPACALELALSYYHACGLAESYMLLLYYLFIGGGDPRALKLEEQLAIRPNYCHIKHVMLDKKTVFAFCPPNGSDGGEYSAIALALSKMGHTVYMLAPYLDIDMDYEIDILETVPISLENIEDTGVCKIIRPINVRVSEDVEIESNIDALLRALPGAIGEGHVMLLGSGHMLDSLFSESETLKKYGKRLTWYTASFLEDGLAMGYAGDYAGLMESVYGFNILKRIREASTTRISVVLPVRGFPHTLPYTLQTCLEQSFKDFEIVVSDNSVGENAALRDYIHELGEPKIKYFHTPAPLGLTKSFEYAFMQARGEFVFSLGADDAMLPWGLELIDHALDACPGDDIIMWVRGFYIWPDFSNLQQLGQMNIITPQADKYHIEYLDMRQAMQESIASPGIIYALPLQYINSGFRRERYLSKIYRETGVFWDGGAQDVPMGVLNACLYQRIPRIPHMVTVAGMSGGSIGATSLSGLMRKRYPEYFQSAETPMERLYPVRGTDYALFHYSLLRHWQSGTSVRYDLSSQDWRSIAKNDLNRLSLESGLYDYFSQYFNHNAKNPDSLVNLKDKTTTISLLFDQYREIPDVSGIQSYREENTPTSVTVDSRKLSITNIKQAVDYMSGMLNL